MRKQYNDTAYCTVIVGSRVGPLECGRLATALGGGHARCHWHWLLEFGPDRATA